MSRPLVVVSVVSHGQGELVRDLLTDIAARCKGNIRVVLTINIPEELPFDSNANAFPIEVIRNERPKGFGANHNQAFRWVSGDYFCVVNPDIRLHDDPFEVLIRCLQETRSSLAVPVVINQDGELEDSVRPFPTPVHIVQKVFGFKGAGQYAPSDRPLHPDWAAGMFMLFESAAFQELGGFDERFFLYYEDVDICARLRLSGREITLCSGAKVVHAARRESHRNLTYLQWHMASMLRFFCSPVFAQLASQGLLARRGTN
ncbi:MAG: glycosyltransferase [Nitrospira sp.]|nr:glycosyltransferase [Nitrospira sp.]